MTEPTQGTLETAIRIVDRWSGGPRVQLRIAIAQAIADAVMEERERRDRRQVEVADWAAKTFGVGQASSLPQRGIRLLEEAIEGAQAAGCDEAMAANLVRYVFSRPKGAIKQELGGVGICVLALAAAAGVSADDAEAMELERIKSKSIAHFAARNQAKNDAGFLAAPAIMTPPETSDD